MSTEFKKGRIKSWSDSNGYGFIVPDDQGKDVFVHKTLVGNISHLLRTGLLVEFREEISDKGRRALEVKIIG